MEAAVIKPPVQSGTLKALTLDCGNGVKMDMVLIPAGEFLMGSPDSEEGRDESESPQHKVTISKPFYMGRYEVTQSQWQAVMGSNPSQFKGDDKPVENVSWDDCQEFCRKLTSRLESGGAIREVRLPSEAQWEYACRAGTTTPFSFGETISTEQVNYNGGITYGNGRKGAQRKKTVEVGSFAPNALGLHDMHGNVTEWCEDKPGSYSSAAQTDPGGASSGVNHVRRGGSWWAGPVCCRSARRIRSPGRYNDGGLRVVCPVGTPAAAGTSELRGPDTKPSNTIPPTAGGTASGSRTAKSPTDTRVANTSHESTTLAKLPPTSADQPLAKPTQLSNDPPPGMALIPAGEFQMGDSFKEGISNELPRHAVYVDAFYMDRTEVTNQQYADGLNWAYKQGNLITVISGVVYQYDSGTSYPYCHTAAGSPHDRTDHRITWDGSTFGVVAGKEAHPMVCVSWYGSVAYANWRSGMQGKPLCYDLSTWSCNFGSGYRLPTEAEWEKAARGGTAGHRFPWADDPNDSIQHARANYKNSSSFSYDNGPTLRLHPTFSTGQPPPHQSGGLLRGERVRVVWHGWQRARMVQRLDRWRLLPQ